nr:ribosomal protein S4 [Sapria himalayana]
MPALRFKTCRLLSGNVRKRELTIIQRRILRRLRNKKKDIRRKVFSRENIQSYIQLQTTRKLSHFYGDLPITEINRGRERTSYIPFLLNLERRFDVLIVRLHFCETLTQARQLISHRRLCVNNGVVSITHLKVSYGDRISFKENDARIRGEERRRSFYIERSVEQIIGKFLDHPVRMWRRSKTEWFRLLKTKRGCRLLLKSRFLQQLRYSLQEEDLEIRKKFGSEKVCLGSSFAEHNRMKINLYYYYLKFLLLSNKEKNRKIPTLRRSPIVYNYLSSSHSIHCSAPQFTMKRIKKQTELPTHYLEVNHRTLKAVVFYGPNMGHIPHDIRFKDFNLILWSGKERGQNI